MKVYNLLSNRDNWCNHTNAVDSNNVIVAANHQTAVKWGLLGAIYKCYGQYTRLDRACLCRAMLYHGFRPVDPFIFNNTQSYETVMKIVRQSGL